MVVTPCTPQHVPEEDLADPLAALQALLESLPTAPRLEFQRTAEGRLEFHTTARQDTLFATWQKHFQVLVDEEAALGFVDDPWPYASDWLGELCAHPEWLDSPQVVQSLTLALTSRFGSLPWMAPSLFEPLALRLERWLTQLESEGEGDFEWDAADNAVLLRTGLALVVGMERGSRQHSRELAELLLSLDEQDSLGLREVAREAGATGAVVRRGTPHLDGMKQFEVDDPLVALARLARARRREVPGPVIAVTGTNGKTATKEMLAKAGMP